MALLAGLVRLGGLINVVRSGNGSDACKTSVNVLFVAQLLLLFRLVLGHVHIVFRGATTAGISGAAARVPGLPALHFLVQGPVVGDYTKTFAGGRTPTRRAGAEGFGVCVAKVAVPPLGAGRAAGLAAVIIAEVIQTAAGLVRIVGVVAVMDVNLLDYLSVIFQRNQSLLSG